MKGIVFTEFLEMVESRFGPEVADRVIEESDLPTRGAYTAVGTYDHFELLRMAGRLGAATGIAVPELIRHFGRHLFGRFVAVYPRFFDGVPSAFALLERIESFIHVEVRKLYPDAELPSFETEGARPGTLALVYRSSRPFAPLAEGLILGCIDHFGTPIDMSREELPGAEGTHTRFVLTRRGEA